MITVKDFPAYPCDDKGK
ncbi:MAG: hypothetical protein R2941_21585 [Desulfobacterales bacterium]